MIETGGTTGVPVSRSPQFGYKNEHLIEVDDDLISKMIENTLRIGVYGKIEQKKRLAGNGGEKLHIIDEVVNEEGDEPGSVRSNKNVSMNTSKLNNSTISPDELERLRKENAELLQQIKRFRETGYVPENKTGCCILF